MSTATASHPVEPYSKPWVAYPYGAPPESTWWRPLVVTVAFLMVTPIVLTSVAFLAILIAPICVVAAPLIAFTMFWPARKARIERARQDAVRWRHAYA